ncbi:MAG TPA: tetratricopeptide repeat protein [Pyrinomonadaceae bacterium]|nr:tetratricopeptide repeat protein [Chloracidobacterium sp.]HQX54702.1 tetratricopeptide repeat protein [Pyrinomonadaceae bacterium]MBK9437903.1 tetratricopeptide repeat protein [Chloracidobacterium sp.]MBL0242257.1 tetratricopeptide repeat protein [Chloracidobacterium sp.]HQY66970.1 tetratricopeptide repeat protein [Pyrinomonadaceae bacterium]
MNRGRYRVSFLVVILFLFVSAATTFGQADNRSSISGFVFGPDRRPVSQVWVELTNDINRTMGRVRTDVSGRYYFPNLPNGRYTVKALPYGTGLVEQSVDVELAGVGSRGQSLPDIQQKDIYLKARKESSKIPFQNAVVYAQDVPPAAAALYKSAIDDIDGQRPTEALVSLEKAVDTFPTYFLALQKLGYLRLTKGDYTTAIGIFERALAVQSRCFDCWYGIGYSKFTLKSFPEAVAATEKALVESPDSVEANLLLGMATRSTKEYEKAETALKRAIKASEGTSADAHWQLALLFGRDLNRYAEAAKELEAYLKVAPEAPNKEDIKKLIKQFRSKT